MSPAVCVGRGREREIALAENPCFRDWDTVMIWTGRKITAEVWIRRKQVASADLGNALTRRRRENQKTKPRFGDLANKWWVVWFLSCGTQELLSREHDKFHFGNAVFKVPGGQPSKYPMGMSLSRAQVSLARVLSWGMAFESCCPIVGGWCFIIILPPTPLITLYGGASWMPKCLWCLLGPIHRNVWPIPDVQSSWPFSRATWLEKDPHDFWTKEGRPPQVDLSCSRQLKCFLSDGWMVEAITLTVICNGSLTL